MIATFCLRLAWGLIVALTLLPAQYVPPRFFRVQYLTALGLLAVAAFFLAPVANWSVWLALAASVLGAFIGSVIWHLDNSPGHRWVLGFCVLALGAALVLGGQATRGDRASPWLVADDVTSAAILGAATSAMLMGHSYLIAPAMSLTPLYRLLGALGVTLLGRIGLASVGLFRWTGEPGAGNLELETFLWLAARWILGFVGPLVLGWMAWETARIRSTQSATGILYVVVILGFLGELTSQLLLEKTGFIL